MCVVKVDLLLVQKETRVLHLNSLRPTPSSRADLPDVTEVSTHFLGVGRVDRVRPDYPSPSTGSRVVPLPE